MWMVTLMLMLMVKDAAALMLMLTRMMVLSMGPR